MNHILTDRSDAVLTLTLNRLDKKNAFSAAMYSTCAQALEQAQNDNAVHSVVIQGHHTIFSAGHDLQDFASGANTAHDAPVFHFLRTLAQFPKPLVAAVCGPAVGIGCTLLLHCDLVYAGDNAAFSMPFVNLGLSPEAAASLLLPQAIGYHRAAQALLLGEPFMAEAALDMGLINRIVPPSEAAELAHTQACKLAAKPLDAILQTKRLMKEAQQALVLRTMEQENSTFKRLLGAAAAQEALSAFQEKRPADFSGAAN